MTDNMNSGMQLNLFFNHYASKHFSSNDYFRDIYSNIGSEYPHSVSEISVLYIPVEFEDLEAAQKQGLQLINKETPKGDLPHYIVRQIVITFRDVNTDFEQDMKHLIEKFGEKAFKYQLVKEGWLNDK